MSVTVCRRSSAQDFLRDADFTVRIGSSMSALGRTAARLDLQTCRYGTSDSRGTALIEFDFKKARAALSASLLAPGPSITSLIGSTAVGNAAGSEDAGTTPSGNAMYGTSAALVGRKRIGWIRFVFIFVRRNWKNKSPLSFMVESAVFKKPSKPKNSLPRLN